MLKRTFLALGLSAAAAIFAGNAQAQQTQIGTLTCEVAGGIGMIVGSRKEIVCTFQNSAGQLEVYDGAITRIGVDIGVTTAGGIVWNVFAPSGQVTRGALAGRYVGAGGEATFAVGLGANVLVGGSRRSVALQPVSFSGQTGINVAGGISEMTLQLRPEPRPRRRG
ncbi:DUF992 domain-containing protein [Enterovirga aerilata]|uniref:DUF992 domain-containing protein n=1 Tax=Enterovirga aerilata TaxID=2730920 RepID=A0A849I725_9HYPH|nr:DUF992 domain-containing protein [Enterovirga sp. DB1703]NNM73091.1 DUF992 domain-containing protein [Enterovirga sp. DB1703]